jgi:dihydrofolate synthase/folylpolyglutamate synthase
MAGSPVDRLGREFWYAPELAVVIPKPSTAITPSIAMPGVPDDNVAREQRMILNTNTRPWPPMHVGLLGQHQMANASLAVAVVQRLVTMGFTIPDEAVAKGLAEVRWPARIEFIRKRPNIVLDCAHNLPSIDALIATLQDSIPVMGGKRVVFAVSQDKAWGNMLQSLSRHFTHFYLTKYGNNPRCVQPMLLGETLKSIHPDIVSNTFQSAEEAWHAARAETGPEDLLVVTGSVFLAGELRDIILAEASAV